MNKEVKIKFSENALAVYEYISKQALYSKSERIMLKGILRNLELIKKNPQQGQVIAKHLIPNEYLKKYNITNLYRMELPFYWRLLYALRSNGEVEVLAIILDVINHKEYNKKFGYK